MKQGKIRKILLGLLVGLLSGVVMRLAFNLPFLHDIELLTLDTRYRLAANPAQANKNIVIVVIDQASLDYLEYPREGREPQFWPWDRFVYANILDYLRPGKPKAIIFDLSFKRVNEAGDDQFAASIRKSGNVYCPVIFTKETDERYTKTIDETTKQILQDKYALTSYPVANADLSPYNMVMPPNTFLIEAPRGLGAANIVEDRDGVLRKATLFFRYQDKIYPSLPMVVSEKEHVLRWAENSLFRISPQGEMLIWWYGPPRTYKYIPFSELYDDWFAAKFHQSEGVRYPPEYFKDKIIFIGTNAPAQGNLHATPMDNVYPGVEAQATILDNLLSGRCLRPAPAGANWLSILVICLLAGLIMFLTRSFLSGMVLTVILFLLVILSNYLSFSRGHYWLELTPPLAGIAVTFTTATIIHYFTEGKEKRRIKGFFSKYIGQAVLEEVLKNYRNLRADVGERKELTILFSDIRGFTSMSESLSPEEVVKLLNEYLSRMVAVIFRHGGTLDKYIGDGIMVFFGAPEGQPDHAVRAVRAAQEMVAEARQLQVKWQQEGKPHLNIGIGINTGEVIVGNIGSEERLDYTVIGDNVNLAARLEPLNKEYGTNIIISQFTAQHLADFGRETQPNEKSGLRELGAVTIRGKEKPVTIYEVLPLPDKGDR